MSHLYIIRGVSGSGKTTFAQKLKDTDIIDDFFEADQFMVDERGYYKFSLERLQECHEKCQQAVKSAINCGKNVAVANTFTRNWEMNYYTSLGTSYTVIRLERRFQNVHHVAKTIVNKMLSRFENFDEKC